MSAMSSRAILPQSLVAAAATISGLGLFMALVAPIFGRETRMHIEIVHNIRQRGVAKLLVSSGYSQGPTWASFRMEPAESR